MTAYDLFEKGRGFLKEGNNLAALSCFEKAYKMEKIRGIRSYLGLCLALERTQINEGMKLCNESIGEEPGNPFHYLHLGKIYVKAGRRKEAIEILRQGLAFGDCEDIEKTLDSLGTRRRPLFPFLPRKHLLNKYWGLLLKMFRIG